MSISIFLHIYCAAIPVIYLDSALFFFFFFKHVFLFLLLELIVINQSLGSF